MQITVAPSFKKTSAPRRNGIEATTQLTFRRALTIVLAFSACSGMAVRPAMTAEAPTGGDNIELDDADGHARHQQMLAKSTRYRSSTQKYSLPDVNLVHMNGEIVSLRELLDHDRPVVLNFIFTSCTTICPVLTATMAHAEKQFLDEPVVPKIISVSIDPEYDTPERLQTYAESYRAGPDWDFLTGDSKSVIAVQRAFDSYRGGKASHAPVTFLRGSGNDSWVRLDGFTTAADLVREFRKTNLK